MQLALAQLAGAQVQGWIANRVSSSRDQSSIGFQPGDAVVSQDMIIGIKLATGQKKSFVTSDGRRWLAAEGWGLLRGGMVARQLICRDKIQVISDSSIV